VRPTLLLPLLAGCAIEPSDADADADADDVEPAEPSELAPIPHVRDPYAGLWVVEALPATRVTGVTATAPR
jgi:hypothetical protein